MSVKVRERPKGSGVWWVVIDHQGKRKSKKIGKDKKLATKVKKEIEAKLVLGDLDLHSNGTSKVPTFKQYIFGWTDSAGQVNIGWLDKYARLVLKNSSCVGYENLLKIHLLPDFGNKPIDQISSRMIGDFIVKKFKEGLRSKTIKNMKNCLSSVLRYAFRPDGYLESNPATGVLVPKPEDERPEREPDPFPWEDRQIFEDVFRNHFPRHYPLILTGFRSGLRIGELMALQWGDIDFRHRLIHVTRNITRGKVTTPKSQSSIRYVRMTTQLTGELKSLLQSRKAEKLKMGWKEMPDWVFYNSNGHFLNYGNFVNRVWNRAMKKSGLCRRTPHDMRHTYATLRLSKGDSLAEVSKEMGHGSTNITYQVYYKWLPKESRTDIDELDNMQPSATYPQPETKEEFPKLANPLK
jgi:integrase